MLDSALEYADLGYRVLPCAPGAKHPLTTNGLRDATSDPEAIEAWWQRWPTANVAIATDGLLVLDLDSTNGKPNLWLADDPEKLLELAAAPNSVTPRGGRHYWFRAPEDRELRNTAGKFGLKVDTRANGGYALVPPSIVAGKAYHWAGESRLDVPPDRLPEPPTWLLGLLTGKSVAPSARSDRPQESNIIPAGRRNSTLASMAGMMRRSGMSQSEIRAALKTANGERCRPPLDEKEVETIAASIAKYPADQMATAIVEGLSDDLPAETGPSDPGAVPTSLLRVPGLIDDVMRYTLATAPYPEPVLAFGGALALQAFLASRKVRDPGDNRSNLYLLGLANSGAGKDWPRKVNQRILFDVGLADCVGDAIASGEGLEDKLLVRPSRLHQLDEMDWLFGAVKQGRDVRYEGIVNILLKMYTSANSLYALRVKAGREQAFIDQPALTLFGTAIPQQLYESMSVKMLTNGLFARMLILEAGKRGVGQDATVQPVPPSVAQAASWWAKYQPGTKQGNLADVHPTPRVVDYTTDAAIVLSDFRTDADREYATAESSDDAPGMAIWSRANEKARRLALNFACSADYQNPRIDELAALWACDFVKHQTRRMLFMAGAHVSENEFDAKCKRLVEVLRSCKGKYAGEWVPFWQVSRRLKGWNPRDHEEVRKALIAQGSIECGLAERDGAGRPGEAYRLR